MGVSHGLKLSHEQMIARCSHEEYFRRELKRMLTKEMNWSTNAQVKTIRKGKRDSQENQSGQRMKKKAKK